MFKNKALILFLILGGFFIANALIAEFIGVKIFSLEQTLGFESMSLSLFGEDNLGFNLTAGVLLWPIVFIMTDIINEYYGQKGVKFLSYLTVGLIIYAFISVVFIFLFLTFIIIKDPNSLLTFPLNLYSYINEVITNNRSFFLSDMSQFILPFLFYFIVLKTLFSFLMSKKKVRK